MQERTVRKRREGRGDPDPEAGSPPKEGGIPGDGASDETIAQQELDWAADLSDSREPRCTEPREEDPNAFLEELDWAWRGLREGEEKARERSRAVSSPPPGAGPRRPRQPGKAAAIAEALQAAAEVLTRRGEPELARWAADGSAELARLASRVDLDALLEELDGLAERSPRVILGGLLAGWFAAGQERREPPGVDPPHLVM